MTSIRRYRKMLYIFISAAGVLLSCTAFAIAANSIPWDMRKIYEHQSDAEDISQVLRDVVHRNGLKLKIAPGVKGTVTFNFTHFPLQGAFNLIIAEHELDYTYDADAQLVTVFNPGAPKSQKQSIKKPKQNAQKNKALAAIQRKLDLEIDQQKLTTLIAETQVRQYKELDVQKQALMKAELNIRRTAAENAPLQKQLAALNEAKKQAQKYLKMQDKHRQQIAEIKKNGLSRLKLEASASAQRPSTKSGPNPAAVKRIKALEAAHERDISRLNARLKATKTAKAKSDRFAKKQLQNSRERISTLSTKLKQQELSLKKSRARANLQKQKQSQQIARFGAELKKQENQRLQLELEAKLAANAQAGKALALEEKATMLRGEKARVELKRKHEQSRQQRRELALKSELDKMRHTKMNVDISSDANTEKLQKQEKRLQRLLSKLQETEKKASAQTRMADIERKQKEQELNLELARMRSAQQKAETETRLVIVERKRREREFNLKLEKMHDAKKKAESATQLATAEREQKSKELNLQLEHMRNAQRNAENENKLAHVQRERREKELKRELQSMQNIQKQSVLEARLEQAKQKNREDALSRHLTKLRKQQEHERMQAEIKLVEQAKAELALKEKLSDLRLAQKQSELETQHALLEKTNKVRELASALSDKQLQSEKTGRLAHRSEQKARELESTLETEREMRKAEEYNAKLQAQKLAQTQLQLDNNQQQNTEDRRQLRHVLDQYRAELKDMKSTAKENAVKANQEAQIKPSPQMGQPDIKTIDATWLYKLAGIGRAGSTRFASINGKDYKVGDLFEGMKVVSIESDRVYCMKRVKNKRLRYMIGFRR